MLDEVRARWLDFSTKFEGRKRVIYADIKGLPTTGIGNLLPDVQSAQALPWKRIADNSLAAPAQIAAEWLRVKGNMALARAGAGAAERQATIYLDPAAIDALVLAKLEANDADLASQFAGWDTLPWQAQMAIHSMAWAMGTHFGYPQFREHVKHRDWAGAARECTISEAGNPGVAPRNQANRDLLIQAASGQQAPAPQTPTPVPVPAPTPAPGGFWAWLAKLFGG